MSTKDINETSQYLTFKLEDEIFAVDVTKIREILDFTPAIKVPGTPDYILGVFNVRGNIVPVVDMRLKFGMTMTVKAIETCIVVMEVVVDDSTMVLGALVDSVQEVFELDTSEIESPPKMCMKWHPEYVRGIGKRSDMLIIILNIDKVFSDEKIAMIQDTGGKTILLGEPPA